MARGENEGQTGPPEGGELEPYYRLIELQKQMMDLLQQNARAERECAVLRKQLHRELEALARSRRSLLERWRASAFRLLQRLRGRTDDPARDSRRLFRLAWSLPSTLRNSLAASREWERS
jgi:phytoene dehydrogenase-like protein